MKKSPHFVGETEIFERAGRRANARRFVFELYVSGATSKSVRAISNFKKVCDRYLDGNFELTIIDVYLEPMLAKEAQIVAIPTLVKRAPGGLRKLIGDLSNTERVLKGLGLSEEGPTA